MKPPVVISIGHLSVEDFPLARPKPHARYEDNGRGKRSRSAADSPVATRESAESDHSRRPAAKKRVVLSPLDAIPRLPTVAPSSRMATANGRAYTEWPSMSLLIV